METVLWYRIDDKALVKLRTSEKNTFVAFTSPRDKSAYLIPLADITLAIEKADWNRDYLEVHIDTTTSRWSELNWDISQFRRDLLA